MLAPNRATVDPRWGALLIVGFRDSVSDANSHFHLPTKKKMYRFRRPKFQLFALVDKLIDSPLTLCTMLIPCWLLIEPIQNQEIYTV